ncbi:class I SAM-dependent methyltransferase [Rhizobium arsenicireducens]
MGLRKFIRNYFNPPKPAEDGYSRPASYVQPADVQDVYEGTFDRRADICKLLKAGGVGVELGVATGWFSHQILKHSELGFLYSIDMWAGDRGHSTDQYKSALKLLMPYREKNSCLRLRFDEALDLFPDSYFDFIYIDGYAHTGEEGGQTLRDWWPKLASGGIFAGDDYGPRWPLVMKEVDDFVYSHKLKCMILTPKVIESSTAKHPTWIVKKP